MSYDVIVKGGRWFDGTGAPSRLRHIGVRDGRVATVSEAPLDETSCPRVVDAWRERPRATDRENGQRDDDEQHPAPDAEQSDGRSAEALAGRVRHAAIRSRQDVRPHRPSGRSWS